MHPDVPEVVVILLEELRELLLLTVRCRAPDVLTRLERQELQAGESFVDVAVAALAPSRMSCSSFASSCGCLRVRAFIPSMIGRVRTRLPTWVVRIRSVLRFIRGHAPNT
jgi:hypothetical protein